MGVLLLTQVPQDAGTSSLKTAHVPVQHVTTQKESERWRDALNRKEMHQERDIMCLDLSLPARSRPDAEQPCACCVLPLSPPIFSE